MRKFNAGQSLGEIPSEFFLETNIPTSFENVKMIITARNSNKIILPINFVQPLSKIIRCAIDDDEMELIAAMFRQFLGTSYLKMSVMVDKASRVALMNQTLSVHKCRGGTCFSTVLANYVWEKPVSERPLTIIDILKVKVFISHGGQEKAHYVWLAEVEWFSKSSQRFHFGYRCPLEVWAIDSEPYCSKSFIPLIRVTRRICVTKKKTFQKMALLDLMWLIVLYPSQ